MISAEAKKAVNLYIPILVAIVVGVFAFKRKVGWQMLLLIMVVAWMVTWMLSRNTLKLLNTIEQKPADVIVSPAEGGTIPSNFDAVGYARQLRDDIYSLTGYFWRDHQLYETVAAMNNSKLAAIANAWKDRYFGEHSETLVQAMKAEVYGNGLWDNTAKNAERIINRLTAIGAA